MKGFTLIELLVATAVLVILSTIGVSVFKGSQTKANDTKVKADVDAITNTFELTFDRKATPPAYRCLNSNDFDRVPDKIGNTFPYCDALRDNGRTFTVCGTFSNNTTYCRKSTQGGVQNPITQNISIPLSGGAGGTAWIGLTVDKGGSYTAQNFIDDLAANGTYLGEIDDWNTTKQVWEQYCPRGCPSDSSSNFYIQLGKGYQVKVNGGSSPPTLTGKTAVLTSLNLVRGQNWISFVSVPASISKASCLAQAINSAARGNNIVSSILTWDFTTSVWRSYIPGFSSGPDNFIINPGIGYRIFLGSAVNFPIPYQSTTACN